MSISVVLNLKCHLLQLETKDNINNTTINNNNNLYSNRTTKELTKYQINHALHHHINIRLSLASNYRRCIPTRRS